MGAAAKHQGGLSDERGAQTSADYARYLLRWLGRRARRPLDLADEHPALGWARSGLMRLTGDRDGPPQMCPVPLAAYADGALAALASLAPAGAFAGLRGSQLLAERAAITGHARNGAVAPGGSCRLLQTADSGIALNLARDEDWTLLPAWLECREAGDWSAVEALARQRSATELVERGRGMGLALAVDELQRTASVPWVTTPRKAGASPRGARARPRVIDLSSLWAGPLCGHLLQRAGAEVIKVESTRRPDGARQGPQAFFDLLNAGKASVALDFASAEGRSHLHSLLHTADIVIESSRPRALRQLGIDAGQILQSNPGLTWISVTGYGRLPPRENWIAYGDDAGVAAGLSAVMRQATGRRLIVGDAVADPLTGLHAALAGWVGYESGASSMISLALSGVVSHCLGFDRPSHGWKARAAAWTEILARSACEPASPRLRRAHGLARPLGADAGILGKS